MVLMETSTALGESTPRSKSGVSELSSERSTYILLPILLCERMSPYSSEMHAKNNFLQGYIVPEMKRWYQWLEEEEQLITRATQP